MAINKLPRGVAMVGAGMCKFGAFQDKTSRDLFVEAFQDMRRAVDKGFDPELIETLYIGNYSNVHITIHRCIVQPIPYRA